MRLPVRRGAGTRCVLGCVLRCVLGCVLVAGCERAAAPAASASPPTDARAAGQGPMLLNPHGFATGTRIVPIALPCADGRTRIVAPRAAVQLVTFTSPGDCSSCQTHLGGLDAVLREAPWRLDHVWVTFSGGVPLASALRGYRALTTGVVCADSLGELWDRHAISHTPVTALLRDGRVLLMHDAPLVTAAARRRLLDALRAQLEAPPGPPAPLATSRPDVR